MKSWKDERKDGSFKECANWIIIRFGWFHGSVQYQSLNEVMSPIRTTVWFIEFQQLRLNFDPIIAIFCFYLAFRDCRTCMRSPVRQSVVWLTELFASGCIENTSFIIFPCHTEKVKNKISRKKLTKRIS